MSEVPLYVRCAPVPSDRCGFTTYLFELENLEAWHFDLTKSYGRFRLGAELKSGRGVENIEKIVIVLPSS